MAGIRPKATHEGDFVCQRHVDKHTVQHAASGDFAALGPVVTHPGQCAAARLAFARQADSPRALRMLLMELTDRTGPPGGRIRTADARVVTGKAGRYLKALTNHFDRTGNGVYDDNHGQIRFPFDKCELTAEGDTLLLHVTADSDTRFERMQDVVASHLVRFAQKEDLSVTWQIATPTPAGGPGVGQGARLDDI